MELNCQNQNTSYKENLFGTTLLLTYSRREALEDGELRDVTETARKAGFTYPVAVTRSLWNTINTVPEYWQIIDTPESRLKDVLEIAVIAAGRAKRDTPLVCFKPALGEGDGISRPLLAMTVSPDNYVTIGYPSDF